MVGGGSEQSPNTKTQTLPLANAIFWKISKNSGHQPYTESTEDHLQLLSDTARTNLLLASSFSH